MDKYLLNCLRLYEIFLIGIRIKEDVQKAGHPLGLRGVTEVYLFSSVKSKISSIDTFKASAICFSA